MMRSSFIIVCLLLAAIIIVGEATSVVSVTDNSYYEALRAYMNMNMNLNTNMNMNLPDRWFLVWRRGRLRAWDSYFGSWHRICFYYNGKCYQY